MAFSWTYMLRPLNGGYGHCAARKMHGATRMNWNAKYADASPKPTLTTSCGKHLHSVLLLAPPDGVGNFGERPAELYDGCTRKITDANLASQMSVVVIPKA